MGKRVWKGIVEYVEQYSKPEFNHTTYHLIFLILFSIAPIAIHIVIYYALNRLSYKGGTLFHILTLSEMLFLLVFFVFLFAILVNTFCNPKVKILNTTIVLCSMAAVVPTLNESWPRKESDPEYLKFFGNVIFEFSYIFFTAVSAVFLGFYVSERRKLAEVGKISVLCKENNKRINKFHHYFVNGSSNYRCKKYLPSVYSRRYGRNSRRKYPSL